MMKWALIAVALLGGVLVLLLLSPKPVPIPKPDIVVEDAATTWATWTEPLRQPGSSLAASMNPRLIFEYAATAVCRWTVGSEPLNAVSGSVEPRLVFEFATTADTWSPCSVEGISDPSADVVPRIVTDYAITSSLNQDLRFAEESGTSLPYVGPRILVEYVEDGVVTGLEPLIDAIAAAGVQPDTSPEEERED